MSFYFKETDTYLGDLEARSLIRELGESYLKELGTDTYIIAI